MTTPTPPPAEFTQDELLELQRIRALVLSLQHKIANLDAGEQHDAYNDQFNRLRFEASAILSDPTFDAAVPKAVSASVLAERSQKSIARLSTLVVVGVVVALVGLGINSVILEDLLVNTVGCLTGAVGMFIVLGALVAMGISIPRRRLTNMAELYRLCDQLVQRLDEVLAAAIPNYQDMADVPRPEFPTAAQMMLDSLEKQAADWNQKLAELTEQQRALGAHTVLELNQAIDFVRREIQRIEMEMSSLRDRFKEL